MKFVNKTIKLLCVVPIIIGTFSLSNFAHANPQCELDEYSLLSYLVNGDKVCGKFFSGSDIVSVIKVLDAYWDWNTTNEERIKLLSDNYGNWLKKEYGWKGLPEPSTEYERNIQLWRGYRISEFQSYSDKGLQITMNMKWSQEAYQGTMTYIFSVEKIDDIWVITDIIY